MSRRVNRNVARAPRSLDPLTVPSPLCYGSRLKPLPALKAKPRRGASLFGTITGGVCHLSAAPRAGRTLLVFWFLSVVLNAQTFRPEFPAAPPSGQPSPNLNVRVVPARPGAPNTDEYLIRAVNQEQDGPWIRLRGAALIETVEM